MTTVSPADIANIANPLPDAPWGELPNKWALKYARQRCKTDDHHIPAESTLVGGFCARLCVDCVNAWHEYVHATPEFKGLRKAESDRSILALAHHIAGAQEQFTLMEGFTAKLYLIAKAWMTETAK